MRFGCLAHRSVGRFGADGMLFFAAEASGTASDWLENNLAVKVHSGSDTVVFVNIQGRITAGKFCK